MRTMRRFNALVGLAGLILGASSGACSPIPHQGTGGATGENDFPSPTGGAGGRGGGQGGLSLGGGGPGGGGAVFDCTPGGPDGDVDEDGFTPADGDCEDCDPNRNPNAVEVISEPGVTPYDEDCDGAVDEDDTLLCDDGLALADEDPLSAVHAIDLCKASTGPKDWGVVSAAWCLSDGTLPPFFLMEFFHIGHGILKDYGPNVPVQAGTRMLALSSGTARRPGDPGYESVNGHAKPFTSNHPPGFPKESPSCPGVTTGQPNDAAGVEIEILPPSNATGFSFDFKFYTYEWPHYICSEFNDFFVALLDPMPKGQTDGNIAFDKMNNPISVNNAFIDVCGCPGNPPAPCEAGGKMFDCPLGQAELMGTGFGADLSQDGDPHGATGWLRTKAPVENPKEKIKLRLAVYDSSDSNLDSTTLIDNFRWIAEPGVTVSTSAVPK